MWCSQFSVTLTVINASTDKLSVTDMHLTLALLNQDRHCLWKQCRSRSDGFWRSHLIRIYTVFHSVCEFIWTNNIELSDWLTVRNGCGKLNLFSSLGSRNAVIVRESLVCLQKEQNHSFLHFYQLSYCTSCSIDLFLLSLPCLVLQILCLPIWNSKQVISLSWFQVSAYYILWPKKYELPESFN